MQNTPAKTQKAAMIAAAGRWLQVSRYDRVSSMLLALLVTIGVVAVVLFILWLGTTVLAPKTAVSPHFIAIAKGGEDGGDGRDPGGSQLDTPSEELVIGKDKETSGVRDDLANLDVAATKATQLDDPEALMPKRHGSLGTRDGMGGPDGPGRGREIGPGRPGRREDPGLPRRWEVVFSKSTLDAYARQVDFFKIELGVVLPGNKIIYVYNLTKSKPDTRVVVDSAASENRYYLTWRNGEMEQADRELLVRAGVDVADPLIVKFLPREIEARLAELERAYAGADATKIGKTRFGVRPGGAGFQFFVLEQSLKR
jgi:hypothetical protein